jgi:hypothetical protein
MSKRPRRAPAYPTCANCGERLKGPWCHACGQHAEGLHRSVRQVAVEWIEGLVHFDRKARATLPDLIFNPARLTRNFLEGRRAPQMPPLRMFLVVLVLAFAAGSFGDAQRARRHGAPIFTYTGLTPATGLGKPVAFDKMTPLQKAEGKRDIATIEMQIGGWKLTGPSAWLRATLNAALDNPKRAADAYGRWSRQLAIALLPIGWGLLCLIFIRRRDVVAYDHLIFAMHSLSFLGILFAATELLAILPGAPAVLLMALAPVHLFAHMRGVYRTSIPGTLARVGALSVGAVVTFIVIVLAVVSAVLVEMAPR